MITTIGLDIAKTVFQFHGVDLMVQESSRKAFLAFVNIRLVPTSSEPLRRRRWDLAR